MLQLRHIRTRFLNSYRKNCHIMCCLVHLMTYLTQLLHGQREKFDGREFAFSLWSLDYLLPELERWVPYVRLFKLDSHEHLGM